MKSRLKFSIHAALCATLGISLTGAWVINDFVSVSDERTGINVGILTRRYTDSPRSFLTYLVIWMITLFAVCFFVAAREGKGKQ